MERWELNHYVTITMSQNYRFSYNQTLISSRFIHSKAAATRPLPIERALKTDMLTIMTELTVNNILIPEDRRVFVEDKRINRCCVNVHYLFFYVIKKLRNIQVTCNRFETIYVRDIHKEKANRVTIQSNDEAYAIRVINNFGNWY